MLSQEVEERLAEYLVNRITEANSYILKIIGETIKEIGEMTPSQARKLQQILKYGGTYEQMAREIARISGKNVQDIYKIFEQVAKSNLDFAEKFYDFRGIDFIPYEENLALQHMVESIGNLTAQTYLNIANTRGIGLLFRDANNQMYFRNLEQSYYEIVDRAILSISQGKEAFYSEMRRIMTDIGNNGVVLYNTGRTRRLDTAVRMNILDGIRQLNIETSQMFGEEYGADGVEISVHENPAPDHEDIQGRQFSKEQYEILESGGEATDVKGNTYDGADKRHIGEYNCYHKIFTIVLGVSEPEYTDQQLKEIIDKNKAGFEYNGKHYTMYKGTQLQRRLETEIRKQKETQILANASGDNELALQCDKEIQILKNRYNEVCNISGLKSQQQRMFVANYKRIKN